MHDSFLGFLRPDGRAGTRNYLGVFIAGNCAATAARRVADWFTPRRLADWPQVDGVLAFVHELGCGMEKTGEPMDLLRRTLGGSIRNPNLAGAVVLALGCERNNIYGFLEQEGLVANERLATVVLQEVGGTAKAVEQGVAALQAMLPAANACRRERLPVSRLCLGLQVQCESGDGVGEAALGQAVDRLVEQGGTVLLSHTRATAPALQPRAADAGVAAQLAQRIHWWQRYTAGRAMREAGPAALASGTAPLQEVVAYGQRPTSRGLVLMDAPGYEAVAATGQVAAGANLVTVLTGQGSGFGAAGAPTVKLAADSALYQRLRDDLDLDCGAAAGGAGPLAERIYRQWLAHASGEPTQAESLGLGEEGFAPWPIGVMA